MIKFFRKIRRNLLSDGKTGKYLKYAVGEIVLVVIGILIALSINNWNSNRADRIREMEYMQSMLVDLQKDKNDLDAKSEFGPIPVIYNDSLFAELQKRPLQGREKRIYHFLLLYTNSIDITYHDRTITQLRNSGGFQLIRNKKVSDAIMDYDIFMREAIKFMESSRYSNLINNETQMNFNMFEFYKVVHLRDSAIIHKNDISKVNYPDDLKLLSYDDDKITVLLNSMSVIRELDKTNYEKAVQALTMNRQLDSLIRKEYHLEQQ